MPFWLSIQALRTSMIPIRSTPPIMRASGVVPGGYDRAATTMALAPLLEQFGVSLDSLLTES
jgi:hypothetical protein